MDQAEINTSTPFVEEPDETATSLASTGSSRNFSS
jgi:hypothetical protein